MIALRSFLLVNGGFHDLLRSLPQGPRLPTLLEQEMDEKRDSALMFFSMRTLD